MTDDEMLKSALKLAREGRPVVIRDALSMLSAVHVNAIEHELQDLRTENEALRASLAAMQRVVEKAREALRRCEFCADDLACSFDDHNEMRDAIRALSPTPPETGAQK